MNSDLQSKLYLHNPELREKLGVIQEDLVNNFITSFQQDQKLQYKDYIVTLLGYTRVPKHTNWYPWNRFLDVFKTIGYQCEWVDVNKIKRKNEKRIFITWNEPTCEELVKMNVFRKNDIIFQKLTSLGKNDTGVNWTHNPKKWYKTWKWGMFQMLEKCIDAGYPVYGFGCKSNYQEFPEKNRIVNKYQDRIYWITWGGTPYNLKEILSCRVVNNNLIDKCVFIGSKWGVVGRGNIDSWEKYITPLEKKGIMYSQVNNHITDDEMKLLLKKGRVCPILHAPSWQAEQGIQDRFYSVFLAGRFGICDNVGAVSIFGEEISDICTEDPEEYYQKTLHFFHNTEEQEKYIKYIQSKIKTKYNFYVQWYNIMCGIKNF